MVTFLTYISNACHSLLGVAERLQHTWLRHDTWLQHSFSNHVTFLSCISNACHSLSGVAERLQHTWLRLPYVVVTIRLADHNSRVDTNAVRVCKRYTV